MNIQEEKLSLIQWISSVDNASVIQKMSDMRAEYLDSKAYGEDVKEKEMESIQRGLEDIEQGNVHSHDSVKNIYEQYL